MGLQATDCCHQFQPCADGPLSVVLVGLGVAEINQNSVAPWRTWLRTRPSAARYRRRTSEALMTSRRSSGSMRVDSAVEPTKSENMTVTWRRSRQAWCGSNLGGHLAFGVQFAMRRWRRGVCGDGNGADADVFQILCRQAQGETVSSISFFAKCRSIHARSRGSAATLWDPWCRPCVLAKREYTILCLGRPVPSLHPGERLLHLSEQSTRLRNHVGLAAAFEFGS